MGRMSKCLGTSADGERGHEIGKLDEGSGPAICSLAFFVARIDHIYCVCGGHLRGCCAIQQLGFVGSHREGFYDL